MDDRPFELFLLANRDVQAAMGRASRADPWAGSPFEWLMRLPSRTRGKAGELLGEAWLTRLGYDVGRPVSSEHDRIVNGRKVEIKFSTLWAQGEYVFPAAPRSRLRACTTSRGKPSHSSWLDRAEVGSLRVCHTATRRCPRVRHEVDSHPGTITTSLAG